MYISEMQSGVKCYLLWRKAGIEGESEVKHIHAEPEVRGQEGREGGREGGREVGREGGGEVKKS